MKRHYVTIEEILQCSFRKEWMSDEDWQMFKDLLKDNGVSIENMSKEIEIGVENGISLEIQLMKLISSSFLLNKNDDDINPINDYSKSIKRSHKLMWLFS